MNNKNQPQYKRGTIIKNGKRYGFYPDGSLYRIYSTSDRPFLEIVDIEGKTFLRIRQATELGYTDCPAPGAADLNYPTSALRRSRTVGDGKLVNALTAASSNPFVFVELYPVATIRPEGAEAPSPGQRPG